MTQILAVPKKEFHKHCDQQRQQSCKRSVGLWEGTILKWVDTHCMYCFLVHLSTVLWLSHALSSEKGELSPSHRMGYLEQQHPWLHLIVFTTLGKPKWSGHWTSPFPPQVDVMVRISWETQEMWGEGPTLWSPLIYKRNKIFTGMGCLQSLARHNHSRI